MQKIKRQFPNIIEAPFNRRLGALIIDLIVSLIIAVLAFMAMDGIYYSTPLAEKQALGLRDVRNASHLYFMIGANQVPTLFDEPKDEEETLYFIEQVQYFYNDAMTPNSGDKLFTYTNSVYYAASVDFDFYVMVLNRGKNTSKFDFVSSGENTYSYSFKSDLTLEEVKDEWNRIYTNAVKDLENSIAYRKANEPMRNFLLFGGAFALALGALLPYLLMPLLFGNGQTVGKYVFGLALVTREGYQVKPHHVVIRYLVLGIFELGASLPLYGVPLFLASASITVTRGSRSIHDLVASTYVVDARQSKIFKNKKDEEKYHLETTKASIRAQIPFYQMPEKSKQAK